MNDYCKLHCITQLQRSTESPPVLPSPSQREENISIASPPPKYTDIKILSHLIWIFDEIIYNTALLLRSDAGSSTSDSEGEHGYDGWIFIFGLFGAFLPDGYKKSDT